MGSASSSSGLPWRAHLSRSLEAIDCDVDGGAGSRGCWGPISMLRIDRLVSDFFRREEVPGLDAGVARSLVGRLEWMSAADPLQCNGTKMHSLRVIHGLV